MASCWLFTTFKFKDDFVIHIPYMLFTTAYVVYAHQQLQFGNTSLTADGSSSVEPDSADDEL